MKKLLPLFAALLVAGCSEEGVTGDPEIDRAIKEAIENARVNAENDERIKAKKRAEEEAKKKEAEVRACCW